MNHCWGKAEKNGSMLYVMWLLCSFVAWCCLLVGNRNGVWSHALQFSVYFWTGHTWSNSEKADQWNKHLKSLLVVIDVLVWDRNSHTLAEFICYAEATLFSDWRKFYVQYWIKTYVGYFMVYADSELDFIYKCFSVNQIYLYIFWILYPMFAIVNVQKRDG